MFSAFMLNPQYGWSATHRLTLDDAISYCQRYRLDDQDCPVAIVPNGEDPFPYLRMAEKLTVSRRIEKIESERT